MAQTSENLNHTSWNEPDVWKPDMPITGQNFVRFAKPDVRFSARDCTVNVGIQNVRFWKPNEIWFCYRTFRFQTFGTNRTNWNKKQFQTGLNRFGTGFCAWQTEQFRTDIRQRRNQNCSTTQQLWKHPKSERSDFGHSLYMYIHLK